jgi:hypothetical protein
VKRGHRILLIAASIIILSLLTWLLWPAEREPEYQGKKLSEWLKVPAHEAKAQGADEAVRHIGTNGIPWLLRWVGYKEPAIKAKAGRWISKLPRRLRKPWVFRWAAADPSKMNRKFSAPLAFRYLGQEGRSAVPALTDMALQTNNEALMALELMGPTGYPGLIKVVEHPGLLYRGRLLEILSRPGLQTNTAVILPVVLGRLNDPDRDIVVQAIASLEWTKVAPERAIPALAATAKHPDPYVRRWCAGALGQYGEASAKPALTALLDDSDSSVRLAAKVGLSFCESNERIKRFHEGLKQRESGAP